MRIQSDKVGCLHPWQDKVGCLHPWQGWAVQTHTGDKVGFVKGQFDTGPHAGLLRVHRARPDGTGTAVFAIPVSAVATAGRGRIVLTHSAPPALADWLAYIIRRCGMIPAPSPTDGS
jgi:hypothetical protein